GGRPHRTSEESEREGKGRLFRPLDANEAEERMHQEDLYRRLPILQWLPKYSTDDAVGDLVAGVTVGLLVIPQSLAYSNIADLPAQYGLYGSFVGCLMYIFLGSCKDVPMGPPAICSLLTYQTIKGMGPDHAILLCFLSGVIQLIMGMFGLGIMRLRLGSRIVRFHFGCCFADHSSQVKDILGINGGGATFVNM
ncbi:sodium-independent sulfate anion transporter-like, partial [Nilaparvata lugens]|uniref:sodium-independent sulfate anion transporter-like n=1 Tax=Nilaparvata lugens TaxID=108931 RepID=UPI00193E038E